MPSQTKIILVAFQVEQQITPEELHEMLCLQVHEREAPFEEVIKTQYGVTNISLLPDFLEEYVSLDEKNEAVAAAAHQDGLIESYTNPRNGETDPDNDSMGRMMGRNE